MKTLRGVMLGAALTLLLVGSRASAQGALEAGMFTQSSDGKIWTLLYLPERAETVRVAIPFKPATDEEIAAFRDVGGWMVPKTDGSSGLDFSPQLPSWAQERPSGGAPASIAAPAAAPAPPAQPTWQTIAKWSGQGSKTTEPFSVNGQWRVIATATQGRVSNQLCISAKRVTDGRLGVNDCLYGGGETYNSVGQTSGSYQMEISGTTGSNWTVEVQALQ